MGELSRVRSSPVLVESLSIPVCQKTINDVTIAASGASTGAYTSGAIFDTGTAYVYLSTPNDELFPT